MGADVVSDVPRRRHRVLVPALLALATVIGFWACFAVWVNRQVLSTSKWTATSTRIVADPRVEAVLSTYLTNELFKAVDVPERLEGVLPSNLKGLAGPISTGLHELANRAVPEVLASRQALTLWERTNRAAHAQFLRIVNGGGRTVSTQNGEVTLNLHDLITQLASQLGFSTQVATVRSKLAGSSGSAARAAAESRLGITLPTDTGRIVIMRSSQLKTVQNIVKGVKGLAILLPLLSLGMLALAVAISTDRRRITLRSAGWCLFGIGVAVLLVRRIAGNEVVGQLVANPADKPAAEAVWSIGTSLLFDIGIAVVAYGLVLVCAAWVGGHTRPATFLRHVAAPWLREHAAGSYGVAAVLLMLVVLWGPTQSTRRVLPVLGFAALAAIGVTALRRQTALEFPDARRGEALALARRHWRRLWDARPVASSGDGPGGTDGGGAGEEAPHGGATAAAADRS
jgi:hypothetical protein